MRSGGLKIGIDLGLKAVATCSDGAVVPALQHYRKYEIALAIAQRAHNTRRVAAIHAKIANSRRHHLHEQSTRIARANELIVVGTAIILGATPMPASADAEGRRWATLRAAAMNIGQRVISTAANGLSSSLVLYLGWFVSPYALIGATVAVLVVIGARPFYSDARAAVTLGCDGPESGAAALNGPIPAPNSD